MRAFIVKYVVSLAFGALLVWLAFRGEDWSDFGRRLASVQVGPIVGYLLLFAAAHVLRIVRWGVLVRALGPVPWRDVFTAGAVGYMCIIAFPLRLGEFVRPYLVRGKGGVTASGALATVVVERVIDGLLFVALFFVFVSLLPESGDPAVAAVKLSAVAAGVVFLTVLVVLIAAAARREWTLSVLHGIGHAIHGRLATRALGLLEAFLDGLRMMPDKRRFAGFLAYTAVYWVALGVGMKLMAEGTHIPDLSWVGGFVLLTVLTVGIMIPAGPGFTGTFEVALKGGFALLVLAPASRENIALYTLMLHATQLLVQVGFGAVWLVTGQVRLGRLVEASEAGAATAPAHD